MVPEGWLPRSQGPVIYANMDIDERNTRPDALLL